MNQFEPYINGLSKQNLTLMARQCFQEENLIQLVLMPEGP